MFISSGEATEEKQPNIKYDLGENWVQAEKSGVENAADCLKVIQRYTGQQD